MRIACSPSAPEKFGQSFFYLGTSLSSLTNAELDGVPPGVNEGPVTEEAACRAEGIAQRIQRTDCL